MPSSWTNSQIVTNLLRANAMWSGSVISFGFPTAAPSWSIKTEGKGFSAAAQSQQDAARLAISLWDDLIAPDFIEKATGAQVTVQNTTTSIGYAHAYFPGGATASGSVWLNPKYNSTSGTNDLVTPKIGAWGFLTYIHELGHALGLEHPANYSGTVTYAANALYQQDSVMYTVMSYFDASNTGADWVASNGHTYYAQTPMLHDVLAIQQLYGVETTTRTGASHYGFNSNIDSPIFDFSRNPHPVLTIWDSAGSDLLDLSGFTTNSRIDLQPGSFSDCDGMTYNIAIAFGCNIENASGGAGNDMISGNTLRNVLRGNGGMDTISGGVGNDKLIGGAGADRLTGGAGRDSFTFLSASDSPVGPTHDVITDFLSGVDTISLLAIDAVAGGVDDAFHLGVGAAFHGEAGELLITQSGGETLLLGDITGDGVADLEIACTGSITFAGSDIIL